MEKTEWYKDQSRIHYVALHVRPGALLFSTFIEFIHFPPSDAFKNAIFHSEPVTWLEMLWFLTTIPMEHKSKAEEIANKLFLTIQDGVPNIIGGGLGGGSGVAQFPMNYPNVFTIENSGEGPTHMYLDTKDSKDPERIKEYELSRIISNCQPKEAQAILDEYYRVKGNISQIGKDAYEKLTSRN